jgi:hypothetical protein
LFKEVASIKSAAAVGMALSDPTLGPKERVGVKVSYGGFNGANPLRSTPSGYLDETCSYPGIG